MIRNHTVSAGAASSKYYEQDGYYTPGSQEAREASEWFGRGAADAGLVGEVDGDTFTRLLDGVAPDGQVLGVTRGGELQHRAGTDLTISAPKEVSVLALVFGDERVTTAHDQTVREVAAYVEQKLIMTRIGRNGETETVNAPNVIAGLFRHDTSREMDPQLHTHAVFLNMVKTELSDKYRSLDTEVLAKYGPALTQFYQARMAGLMQSLGYDARLNRDGFLEVEGVSGLKELFSKRSIQMAKALADRGLEPTGSNKELAALMTRAAKTVVDRNDLTAVWEEQADLAGWSKDRREAFVLDAKSRSPSQSVEARATPDPTRSQTGAPGRAGEDRLGRGTEDVRTAVDFAIRHISEREAVYHESRIKTEALRRMAHPDLNAIDKEIVRLVVDDKRLFSMTLKDGRYFSDSETLMAERDVMREYRSSVRDPGVEIRPTFPERVVGARSPESALELRLRRTTLTDGQKDAIRLSLLGEGRYAGVQGYAGTGKTFMLSKLRGYAEKSGYVIEGIAPTNKARVKLSEVIPDAKTISSFVQDHDNGRNPKDTKKRILIVDEAAMVSTRDFRDLMRVAGERGIDRVIFQGDIKQLEAVGAGVPYKQLQNAGMPTAWMDDVLRYDNDGQREAVLHAARGEVRAAFEKIHAIREHEDVAQSTADAWLGLSKENRAETGIIIPTNRRRREVNDLIRAGLKAEGTLGNDARVLPTIDPLDTTRAMAGDAQSYRKGDTILSVGSIKSYKIAPYSLFKVSGIDVDANTITLSSEDGGKAFAVKLGQNTQAAEKLVAFKEAPREFATGDRVKFNLADRDNGILKGETGTLIGFTKTDAEVALDNGQKVQVAIDSFAGRGLDHAYALTAHAYQGDDTKDIIAGISAREYLATQKALYVAISRARTDATLITDDRGGLMSAISQKTGESYEALTEVTAQRLKDLDGTRGFTQAPQEPDRTRSEGLEQGAKEAAQSGAERPSEESGKGHESDTSASPSRTPEKTPAQTPEPTPSQTEEQDRKLAEKMLADEARSDGRNDRAKDAENDAEPYDSDAVKKDLEERWAKFAEDRSRGRGERSL